MRAATASASSLHGQVLLQSIQELPRTNGMLGARGQGGGGQVYTPDRRHAALDGHRRQGEPRPMAGTAQPASGLEPDTVEARAGLYGVLSRVFGNELTPEFVLALDECGFLELLEGVASSPDPLLPEEPDFEALAAEYARLFVGPGQPAAPPYASVHRDEETTGEVKRFMAHYGLAASGGTIPDHVTLLFEFMERLLLARIDAADRGDAEAVATADELAPRFISSYLKPWVERFLRRLLAAHPAPFYAAVAEITLRLMELESQPE